MNPSIVKRCLVGAVLAIAATLPGFQQLHTSVEGLKLIVDYEGCRLQPYQCSAGVQRVELASPLADVVLNKTQAASCTQWSVTNGGTDE